MKVILVTCIVILASCQKKQVYICTDYHLSNGQWDKGESCALEMSDKEYSIYMTEKTCIVNSKTECCKR